MCRLLRATNVAGRPGSFFHEGALSAWAERFDLRIDAEAPKDVTAARIIDAARIHGNAGTGIFGFRLQRHSFDFFIETLATLYPEKHSDRDRFEAAFGRTLFVHLSRKDKVNQAVSYVKAEQTGLWHQAPDGTEIERLSPPREPEYDESAIRAIFDRFTDYDLAWRNWFEGQGILPLAIGYEDLASDPEGTLRQILERLGRNGDAATGVEPEVAKLADATNKDWAARFRAANRLS